MMLYTREHRLRVDARHVEITGPSTARLYVRRCYARAHMQALSARVTRRL